MGGGDAIGMRGGWTDSRLGGRARAERTQNMACMVVTLDVSKLSGWLNAFACCRVEGRECDVGRGAGLGGVRALGGGDTCGMCTGRDLLKAVGGQARPERTPNILRMLVTLDVSKLSGWLNALADCRVERRACDLGRGAAREAA